jgi:hypothetical protein
MDDLYLVEIYKKKILEQIDHTLKINNYSVWLDYVTMSDLHGDPIFNDSVRFDHDYYNNDNIVIYSAFR